MPDGVQHSRRIPALEPCWEPFSPQQPHKHPPWGHAHCVTHRKPTHTTHAEVPNTSRLQPDDWLCCHSYRLTPFTHTHLLGSPKGPHKPRRSHTQDPRRSSSHAPGHTPGAAEPFLAPARLPRDGECWPSPRPFPPVTRPAHLPVAPRRPGWRAWGRVNCRLSTPAGPCSAHCPGTWARRVARPIPPAQRLLPQAAGPGGAGGEGAWVPAAARLPVWLSGQEAVQEACTGLPAPVLDLLRPGGLGRGPEQDSP